MNQFKKSYTFVMKSVKKDKTLIPFREVLNEKTYIIAGGSRGIGFNIAKKLILNGANVVITGKTVNPHPKLDGTIYSASEYLCDITKSNRCSPIQCDIRNHHDIDFTIKETLNQYGSIDGVVLNASALCLNNTINQTQKEINLMNSVNINGTYMFGKKYLEYTSNNKIGQMLIISPPLDMIDNDDWWVNHFYYSMSKYNMSLMAKYWNKEFKNVGVNTLWPRTTIDTAPVRNILGGSEMVNISRHANIMGDAALHIFKSNPLICNGKNFIDDEVLASLDIDLEKYKMNPNIKDTELMPDFFC